jgi:hypothetical protein
MSLIDFQTQVELLKHICQETKKIPVICLDSNPHRDLDLLAEKIQQELDTPFFILGCDARPNAYTHPCVDYWPFWLIQQQTEKNYQKQIDKQHRISFLSGIPKYHRLQLFNKIKPCITDQDVVVVNNIQASTVPNKLLLELVDSLPWANRPEYIDIPIDRDYIYSSQQNTHAAYAACVNITAETVDYCVNKRTNFDQIHFISEKTWKAYRSGCLVINYGVDSLPATLAHHGFKIWEEYDVCAGIDKKIDCIVDLFNSPDVVNMYNANFDQVLFNQQLMSTKSLVLKFAESAIKKINNLL